MDKGVKLFGVRLNNRSDCPLAMRKSVSMGNLSGYTSPETPSPSTPRPVQEDGYASDDFVQTSSSSSTRERKKGVPWTEDEHSLFLIGLQKLGKGDWRGISRNFVKTRTPTQVASHAQKYFLRQSNINKRRRRSSLFDITPDKVACMVDQEMQDKEDAVTEAADTTSAGGNEKDSKKMPPVTGFPLPLPPSLKSDRSDQTLAKEAGQYTKAGTTEGFNPMHQPSGVPFMLFPVGIPNFDPHMFSIFSFYHWASMQAFDQQAYWPTNKNIVKPTPVIPQGPIKIDESLKISELSIDSAPPMIEPTPLSFKLLEDGSRNSAFHATSSVVPADIENQGSAISVA